MGGRSRRPPATRSARGDGITDPKRHEGVLPRARAAHRDTVVDLTARRIQLALAARLRGRGSLRLQRRANAFLTITCRAHGTAEAVEVPVAQLRVGADGLHLFRRRSSGRWVPYCAVRDRPFVGSLARCLAEIAADRRGCFWK